MATRRKYPVGIQTFSRIINEGYVYIDKTDLVWKLQDYARYIFLSRPRRFGKSLLSTTLESYFLGEKELFKGLKINDYETEWKRYPVIHLDVSVAKGQTSAERLEEKLFFLLEPYVKKYGREPVETTPGSLFSGLIRRAYEQAGEQVAIIIDEYDAPLLDVLHEDHLAEWRRVMQEFYQTLKSSEAMVKFCFITGITKFSQLSIFSSLNNITNVSLDDDFASICGITQQEIDEQMSVDIEMLAEKDQCSISEMRGKLKAHYDGYHFASESPEIYNPFSLMKAFNQKKLSNYWFESGTPTFLIRQLQRFGTDITSLERIEAPSSSFDRPTEAMDDALPLLYQSGYLTIKSYDREARVYTLAIPNQEVRIGYTEGLLPAYTGIRPGEVQTGFALKFWRALKQGDVDLAMREMQAFMAGIPYVEGFKKKLAEAATAEGFYEYTMYLILSMLNVYVRTQVKCISGRVDMVVWMPDTTYVFELKVNGTAQEALRQIDERGYAFPFLTEGHPVVKVGVKFNPDTRVPEEWVVGC